MKGHWISVERKAGRDLAGSLPRSLLVKFEPELCRILEIKILDPSFPPDFGPIQKFVGRPAAKSFSGREWERRGVELA